MPVVHIQPRIAAHHTITTLIDAGIPPLLARLYAARGIHRPEELDTSFRRLLPPEALRGTAEAAQLLADAIEANARMVIVADYDCDGATACAVGIRALRAFGADVHYLVPDRLTLGYGLSPAIVEIAARLEPDLLITVDNGIASIEGVNAARACGMATLITDHHLPGDTLPEADVIINPNQPGCDFPSKALAGVGVMFYTMLALRAELRERGAFKNRKEPNLAHLLDLVALGTVADVVSLDHNNRILVAQGLKRIRAGQMQAGLQALFSVAGRSYHRASTFDLGFTLAPRMNAAGRLSNMRIGIECLITDDPGQALNLAQTLDQFNRERRAIEIDMQAQALQLLEEFKPDNTASITLFESDWHQGVTGIIAGRIKERFHRPTFAFARSADGELKGSGRSISGLHLRDALDLISKRYPELIQRFGGHAMAAGLTLLETDLPRFRNAFENIVAELIPSHNLNRTLETDGDLENSLITLQSARLIEEQIWGHDFPAPIFSSTFIVERQRLLKDRHLKIGLSRNGSHFEAIRFNHMGSAPARMHAAYQLNVNEYNGTASVQLTLIHFETA